MTLSREKIYDPKLTKKLTTLINKNYCYCQPCLELVLAGANPNVKNNKGETLLTIAAKRSELNVIPELLHSGANPRIADLEGQTPLTHLLQNPYYGKFEIAIACIQHGANPNTRNQAGWTLLHASAKHHAFFIPQLIEAGVNPHLKDEAGKTAFEYLLEREPIYRNGLELICAGADLASKNEKGETFTDICKANSTNMFEYAARFNPKLLLCLQARHILSDDPVSIFKILLFKGELKVAIALLQSYDKRDYLNYRDETFIHIAIDQNPSLIFALLKMDFDPRYCPQGQEPALKKVLSKNCQIEVDEKIQVALALIKHGADANVTNEDNQNILQIIYQTYPSIQNELEQSCGFLFEYTPEKLLRSQNISDLRIQLKYLSLAHQARNGLLNFIILLTNAYSNEAFNQSFFSMLPNELIAHIISFLDIAQSKKSMHEIFGLIEFVYENISTIKVMLSTPGSINVMQRKTDNGRNSFTLFKSAENLSYIYRIQKNALFDLTQSQKNISQITCDDIIKKYALDFWVKHGMVFTDSASKLAFLEKVNDTELYKDVRTQLKLKTVS